MILLTEKKNLPIIVIGAGGHAKVVIDTLQCCRSRILGFTNYSNEIESILGVPYLGNDSIIDEKNPDQILLAIGMGTLKSNNNRKKIFDYWKNKNYSFVTIIHPTAIISGSAEIGEGSQILMGVVIQTEAKIKENCIVNTRCSIDHNSIIHAHSHIAPGTTICGNVIIEPMCHIGAGATIIQNIRVAESSTIGAGAVVIKNTNKGETLVGIPAREISQMK